MNSLLVVKPDQFFLSLMSVAKLQVSQLVEIYEEFPQYRPTICWHLAKNYLFEYRDANDPLLKGCSRPELKSIIINIPSLREEALIQFFGQRIISASDLVYIATEVPELQWRIWASYKRAINGKSQLTLALLFQNASEDLRLSILQFFFDEEMLLDPFFFDEVIDDPKYASMIKKIFSADKQRVRVAEEEREAAASKASKTRRGRPQKKPAQEAI